MKDLIILIQIHIHGDSQDNVSLIANPGMASGATLISFFVTGAGIFITDLDLDFLPQVCEEIVGT